ncbi:MAG: septum formation initiator family protein [Deltaproteobacteria bacterium]|nr:septum formation initiator family protein [Deltaproteobacteria bacterium]
MNTRKKIIFLVASAIFVLLFAVIIFSKNGYMAFHRLKQEELAWINENKKIEAENLKLYHKIERLKHDPEYIENVARQELGMTGKDEIIIKFKNKKNGK